MIDTTNIVAPNCPRTTWTTMQTKRSDAKNGMPQTISTEKASTPTERAHRTSSIEHHEAASRASWYQIAPVVVHHPILARK